MAERAHETNLFILAFDHRGSFQKDLFGVTGDPTPEQADAITDIKHLIFEAMIEATRRGLEVRQAGVLVDEQYGGTIPEEAKSLHLVLAMPVEKSGQDVFDFEYGDHFGEHIEELSPEYVKVLVRYNPEGSSTDNATQRDRLKTPSDWLAERDRKFLFEVLVPATEAQLASVGDDSRRYDLELRPQLMRRTIEELQNAGIEPVIWKIEGLDRHADNEMIAHQAQANGRDHVSCIVLGRDADDAQLNEWLTEAAPISDFIGFAIGRSIWLETLQRFVAGTLDREATVADIATRYLKFIKVYQEAQT